MSQHELPRFGMPRVAERPEIVLLMVAEASEPPSDEHREGKCESTAKLMPCSCHIQSDHASQGAVQFALLRFALESHGTEYSCGTQSDHSSHGAMQVESLRLAPG